MEAFRLFLFGLAALTSIGCMWLLFRGYSSQRSTDAVLDRAVLRFSFDQ